MGSRSLTLLRAGVSRRYAPNWFAHAGRPTRGHDAASDDGSDPNGTGLRIKQFLFEERSKPATPARTDSLFSLGR
ncbi:hypothetical protein AUR64_18595 [Haloprofundus marisrubri]|uniref:Uncharacterized protein n=1 Tax=Haloprofundus marisrubri TaxID=1514971 RepID=A0A0W1R5T5_9EURY|nr:hypothetical protein AUR64_18595 [Haloprofundus marisrubri]